MSYTHSFVMMCPAPAREAVEQFGLALGHSGQEFSVALSADGAAPPSHYGLHTWALPETVALFMTDAAVPGLTPEQIAWLRATLVMSASTEICGAAHFEAVCAAHGLQRIVEEGEP